MNTAIFDMDGTLIDSMPYWQTISTKYFESIGIKVDDKTREKLEKIIIPDAALYMKEKFNLKDINNIPSKEGYIFEGWYLDVDYKTECTLEEISYADNITTLYAKMTEENTDVVLTLIVGENTTTKTMVKRQEFTLKSIQPTIEGIEIDN